MKIINIIFLVLISSGITYSQIYSSYKIERDSVEIGDEVDIYYSIATLYPESVSELNFQAFDSITSEVDMSSFVKLSKSIEQKEADKDLDAFFMNFKNRTISKQDISFKKYGNQFEYRDTFSIRFWDMGLYTIPHPEIIIDSSQQVQEILVVQPPVLLVTPTLAVTNQDTTSAILPINEIILTPKTWKDYIWYALIPLCLLLLLGLGLYFFITKNKPQQETIIVQAPKKPAHVIALNKLNILKTEQGWKIGKVKEYQSALTYTIREYLENNFGINALEQTTDEIQTSLKKNKLSETHVTEVSEILRIADLVKFAKAKPSEDINETFLTKAFDFVNETKVDNSLNENSIENG